MQDDDNFESIANVTIDLFGQTAQDVGENHLSSFMNRHFIVADQIPIIFQVSQNVKPLQNIYWVS